jgi:hypothetical protein
MIIIQTNRIFVVPEIPEESNKNSTVLAKIQPKKEQINYSKKEVKYFIPKFYI